MAVEALHAAYAAIIEVTAIALELSAALIIVLAGVAALWRYVRQGVAKPHEKERTKFARSLLLALDFTIAADVLKVAVAPTFAKSLTIGLVVLVRILLTFTLEYELSRVKKHESHQRAEG